MSLSWKCFFLEISFSSFSKPLLLFSPRYHSIHTYKRFARNEKVQMEVLTQKADSRERTPG